MKNATHVTKVSIPCLAQTNQHMGNDFQNSFLEKEKCFKMLFLLVFTCITFRESNSI